CCMSPAEDALLLLGIVRRHLRALEQTLQLDYPNEDWGFTAQQVIEKILKGWIVLADQRPPHTHELKELLPLTGMALPEVLLQLQVFAVEARYEEGPFPLPAPRAELMALLQGEVQRLERAISEACD
ncbi:MAG: HEPN domain-containing protein, partial [Cyanobacteriota bacterium]|nr:HEPN domain-containing protein [Cyanobacteriota bacterium]